MSSRIEKAVEIYRALGWEDASAEEVLNLPAITSDQKRTALAGLKSGDWFDYKETDNGWEMVKIVDTDLNRLALFAIEVGVDARRAADVLRTADDTALEIISRRGAEYAADFITFACTARRRMWEHSLSAFGNLAVRLVDRFQLKVPESIEYMKDWSACAAHALGLSAELQFQKLADLPGLTLISRRFAEHIRVGAALNMPVTGPFGQVFPEGCLRGWIVRSEALSLAFAALDSSLRPGDRKVWIRILDQLGLKDDEIIRRTESLIPLLAGGDSPVIERLAPVLIEKADEDRLTEILLAAFSGKVKKTRQLLLKSALKRNCPSDKETLGEWLSLLAADSDKATAVLVRKLMEKWQISVQSADEKAEPQGLWQRMPKLWQIPDFAVGEVTPEHLTELAVTLSNRSAFVHDIVTERFLALTNQLAQTDPQNVKLSLAGLQTADFPLLSHTLKSWCRDEMPSIVIDSGNMPTGLLSARIYQVCRNIDKVPCLLSTPSFDDLSIRLSDLVSRLEQYQREKADILEADFQLALARLDIAGKTAADVKALEKLDLPLIGLPMTAGEAVLRYIKEPIPEPSLDLKKLAYWRRPISRPEWMKIFPDRFDLGWNSEELFSIFPLWGDYALSGIRWDSEVYHGQGLILRQTVRRRQPLPSGASVNLLAAQRSNLPDEAENVAIAAIEAWQRGLLHPGTADIAYLDWQSGEPTNLAALAAAFDTIAGDGLLAVVWPLIDDLVAVSLRAVRLLAGTAELVKVAEKYLPEAEAAVEKAIAEKSVLDLPAIRALADKKGNSIAVTTAKALVKRLPPAAVKAAAPEERAFEVPFAEVWKSEKIKKPVIEDEAELRVSQTMLRTAQKLLLFHLSIPAHRQIPIAGGEDLMTADTAGEYQIVNTGWVYSISAEGQMEAVLAAPGAEEFAKDEASVWLHWDKNAKKIAISKYRNWRRGASGPLDGGNIPPLPLSLLTVVIGLLAQDGEAAYSVPAVAAELMKRGELHCEVVKRAAAVLLKSSEAVSPAKLVRSLEKNIYWLPVFYPLLTESIKYAGQQTTQTQKPPVWVNRILEIAVRYAAYLKEAAERGLISAEEAKWTGLAEIADAKAKSAATEKARTLRALLGV